MNIPSIALWGFGATIVLTIVMGGSQYLSLTRMSLPFLLGTVLTPNRDRAMVLGSLAHLAGGWAFASVYALVFESLGRASWALGSSLGAIHGLFILVVLMPLMPGLHPRMVSEGGGSVLNRQLQPPGFMALNYGPRTPLVTMVAHAVYGMILGGFYTLAG